MGILYYQEKLANSNHFPAIDVNGSISRLMNSIVDRKHLDYASKFRDILSTYEKNN